MTEVLEFCLFCGTGRLCGPHGTATSFNATSMLALQGTSGKRRVKKMALLPVISGQVKRTHGYAWYHPREPNAMLNTHRGHVSSCPLNLVAPRRAEPERGGGGAGPTEIPPPPGLQ